MNQQNSEILAKIRQQFDSGPYPRKPLELSPKKNYGILFQHNLVTPYYLRNQKLTDSEGKIILDAGCGSGYKALALAEANPGAKIIGIDISEESIKLATERLNFHGFTNSDFYVLDIEDLPNFGMQFDYINIDEVLYLLPEPMAGLQALKAVLKPDGIMRANLHSYYQRLYFFQAQKLFNMMGLMDATPGELEMEIVREIIEALKNDVVLKHRSWLASPLEKNEEWILCNYLLQGDKGFTIPEMFSMLEAAELEFISMVNWRRWEILSLFKEPDNLPAFLAMSLPEISIEDRLHIYELLNPVNRLLDFWCGHADAVELVVPVAEWEMAQWESARAHLHPQLRNEEARETLLECIESNTPFEISRYIPQPTTAPLRIESSMAACLLPLWQGGQSVSSLVERWLQVQPVHPATLEPVNYQTAFEEVRGLLTTLETFVYVLLECLA